MYIYGEHQHPLEYQPQSIECRNYFPYMVTMIGTTVRSIILIVYLADFIFHLIIVIASVKRAHQQ